MLPVPGGFGVLEVGLAATLILYARPPPRAAAVVVCHAIAFWVPSLGGLMGYGRLRRRPTRGVPPIDCADATLKPGAGVASGDPHRARDRDR
jgi:hypothetical protein